MPLLHRPAPSAHARVAHAARLCPIALALLMCAGAAQAQTWKPFTSTVDAFEVDVPAAANVDISPTELDAAHMKRTDHSTNYSFGDEPALLINVTLAKFEVNFSGGVHDSYGALKCKTTTVDKPLPFDQGQARAINGEGCFDGTASVLARYFTVGKWFYQVLTAFHQRDAETARHFVDSFTVLPHK